MAFYKLCDDTPFSLSIQFDKKCMEEVNKLFKFMLPCNQIGNHISIKYIGYERDLSDERLDLVLKQLRKIFSSLKPNPLAIGRFKVFNDDVGYNRGSLYLSVCPNHYLVELHNKAISSLVGLTDIFEMNDLLNFIPHISCGKINDLSVLEYLNAGLSTLNQVWIKNWYLVVHTSRKEYPIFV